MISSRSVVAARLKNYGRQASPVRFQAPEADALTIIVRRRGSFGCSGPYWNRFIATIEATSDYLL
jgi:hypothetical protein